MSNIYDKDEWRLLLSDEEREKSEEFIMFHNEGDWSFCIFKHLHWLATWSARKWHYYRKPHNWEVI